MAEQLAVHEGIGNRPTVHADERSVSTARYPVDVSRDDVFTNTGLTQQEHWAVVGGNLSSCLHDRRVFYFDRKPDEVQHNIWSIGGTRGWYYGNWLWKLRGYLDKLSGGIGLRRGRRSPDQLKPGDSLDFWRVLLADERQGRLLLYAEMKLPGEAWLEFHICHEASQYKLVQQATFRPRGVWGRLYWYSVLPFHALIFPGMAKGIIHFQAKASTS